MAYKITRVGDRDDLANSAIEIMEQSEDTQNDAYLGAFWYDPYKKEVYGHHPTLASDREFQYSSLWGKMAKTGNALHKSIWAKEEKRGKDKRFSGDYTMKPRGRVFEFKDEGFIVFVGNWINNYPEAKEEILEEFQLPKDNTEFRIDSHWDIGHGWSQEM